MTNEWMYILSFLILYPLISEIIRGIIEDKIKNNSFEHLFNKIIKDILSKNDYIIKDILNNTDIVNNITADMLDNNDSKGNITKQILDFMYKNKDKSFSWKELNGNESINNGEKFDRTNFYILYSEKPRAKNKRNSIFGTENTLVDSNKNKYKITDSGISLLNNKK